MSWLFYAVIGAIAAGATAILAKVGVAGVPSNLAVAVRTAVVLVFAAGIVMVRGDYTALRSIRGTVLLSLVLSGIATGISWLAYFKALQLAPASWVVPVDKLSLPITVILAAVLLGEVITMRMAMGLVLMVSGAVLVARG